MTKKDDYAIIRKHNHLDLVFSFRYVPKLAEMHAHLNCQVQMQKGFFSSEAVYRYCDDEKILRKEKGYEL